MFIRFFLAVVFLPACSGCSNSTTQADGQDASNKFTQYYVQGEELFLKHCSNCHQKNGTGLGRLYPPLNKSDFVDSHMNDVLCIMRHGRSGELIVNGKNFNQKMPGIPSLTDLEIAEIATYIFNTWDRKHGIVDVKTVSPILNACEKKD